MTCSSWLFELDALGSGPAGLCWLPRVLAHGSKLAVAGQLGMTLTGCQPRAATADSFSCQLLKGRVKQQVEATGSRPKESKKQQVEHHKGGQLGTAIE